jgi:hypothetical protein
MIPHFLPSNFPNFSSASLAPILLVLRLPHSLSFPSLPRILRHYCVHASKHPASRRVVLARSRAGARQGRLQESNERLRRNLEAIAERSQAVIRLNDHLTQQARERERSVQHNMI